MIHLYTGEWNMIPPNVQDGLELRGWEIATQEQVFQYGKNLLDRNASVFSNNELVLLGLRVAIRERYNAGDVKAHLNLTVTFYSRDYPDGAMVHVDSEGNIHHHYKGFFDKMQEGLLFLL